MYLIDKNTELSTLYLGQVIQQFQTTELPKYNRLFNYYNGKMDILNKQVKDKTKPCNRIVTNFCKYITDSYDGYLTGIDITYSSPDDIGAIQDVLNYNDVASVDSQLLRNALIFGVGYELMWIDEDAKQRFGVVDSREIIPLFYNTVDQELAAVIRFYSANTITNDEYYIELYLPSVTFIYKSDMSFTSFQLIDERPNYYGQVPINILPLNDEWRSVFEPIMGLNDAYNKLLSSETDDWEAFCDAYLVLQGMEVDDETIHTMKENRVLLLPDGGSAEYLTKSVADTQIENMLNNIEQKIHKISACPDFSSEAFGTSSGIAMKMKLLGFENASGVMEKAMTKTLQRRIELITAILSLSNGESLWRDIQIVFTRNLPTDASEVATEVNTLRGLVSDRTLISQLPFVQDVDAEMDLIKAQKEENAALYNFGTVLDESDKEAE